jgi:hypothetical protein
MENEGAKARYRAVKNTTTVTPGKLTTEETAPEFCPQKFLDSCDVRQFNVTHLSDCRH